MTKVSTPKEIKIELGQGVELDAMRLIDGRMIVCASSGGGKSYLIRVLCEQVVGKIPTILLDRDGEFATLREQHDVVLVGEGGEADTSVATAAKLARSLVELGVSAVVSLYSLSKQDKRKFVRIFLDALMNLPRSLWRPMIVVLDEAHEFCPEAGRDAESREAVIRMMDSGRKHGIAGVLATQRFSKLSKDAAAEAGNVCIGRTTLDNDLRRASDQLGFGGKTEWQTLRELDDGEWFAYGPAFNKRGVQRFKGAKAKTTHPKPGQRHAIVPPAPSRAILKVAADLKDLKQKADAEQSELEALRAKVKELQRGKPPTSVTTNGTTKTDERALATARAAGRTEGFQECMSTIGKSVSEIADRMDAALSGLDTGSNAIHAALKSLRTTVAKAKLRPADRAKLTQIKETIRGRTSTKTTKAAVRPTATDAAPELGTSGMQRILHVLALHPDGLTAKTIGLLARIAAKGGTFATYIGRLKGHGWIEKQGNLFVATEAGVAALGQFEPLPSGDDLREYWLGWCGSGSGQRRLLEVIIEAGEDGVVRDEAATAANLAGNAGTFATYLGRLRSAQLVETFKDSSGTRIRASAELLG